MAGCADWRAGSLFHTAIEFGARGQWNEALHYFERLWVEFPFDRRADEARLQAARIYAGPGRNPRSAEQQYREILRRGRDLKIRRLAVTELTELYVKVLGTPDRAIEILEAWRQQIPDDAARAEASIRLAQLHLQAGRLLQAVYEAEPWSMRGTAETQARALVLVAQARELAGAVTASTDSYARAVALSSEGSDLWVAALEGEVRMLEESGHWQEAVSRLSRLRASHPNPDALARWEEAIRDRHAEMNR